MPHYLTQPGWMGWDESKWTTAKVWWGVNHWNPLRDGLPIEKYYTEVGFLEQKYITKKVKKKLRKPQKCFKCMRECPRGGSAWLTLATFIAQKGESIWGTPSSLMETKCLSLIVQIMPTDELQNQPSMSGSHRVCRKKLYVIKVQGVLRDINSKRVKWNRKHVIKKKGLLKGRGVVLQNSPSHRPAGQVGHTPSQLKTSVFLSLTYLL